DGGIGYPGFFGEEQAPDGHDGDSGAGGAGVVSIGGSQIITKGEIKGGKSADGDNAYAVKLSGGGNILVLENGYSFVGGVHSVSGNQNDGDTLALGGDTNGTFLVDAIGNQYTGFAR